MRRDVSHINLNDKTVEGLAMQDRAAADHPVSFRGHVPGPLDNTGMFDRFVAMMAQPTEA